MDVATPRAPRAVRVYNFLKILFMGLNLLGNCYLENKFHKKSGFFQTFFHGFDNFLQINRRFSFDSRYSTSYRILLRNGNSLRKKIA